MCGVVGGVVRKSGVMSRGLGRRIVTEVNGCRDFWRKCQARTATLSTPEVLGQQMER
jgi:hypothetical protein